MTATDEFSHLSQSIYHSMRAYTYFQTHSSNNIPSCKEMHTITTMQTSDICPSLFSDFWNWAKCLVTEVWSRDVQYISYTRTIILNTCMCRYLHMYVGCERPKQPSTSNSLPRSSGVCNFSPFFLRRSAHTPFYCSRGSQSFSQWQSSPPFNVTHSAIQGPEPCLWRSQAFAGRWVAWKFGRVDRSFDWFSWLL